MWLCSNYTATCHLTRDGRGNVNEMWGGCRGGFLSAACRVRFEPLVLDNRYSKDYIGHIEMSMETTMHTASVSQLKTHVSEYMGRVRSGEELLLTDRGRPFAKIVPLRRDEQPADDRMAQLERAGLVRLGKGSMPADLLAPRIQVQPGVSSLAALLAERAEDER
jgi:prevent-host-death family protein